MAIKANGKYVNVGVSCALFFTLARGVKVSGRMILGIEQTPALTEFWQPKTFVNFNWSDSG